MRFSWLASLVVTLFTSLGCEVAVEKDAGCPSTGVPNSNNVVAVNSPTLYDCSVAACAPLSVCNESTVPSTSGQTPLCPLGETSCSDGIDNNRNGFLDCADCGCCADPSCANSVACGCEQIPAKLSFAGYAKVDGGGVPACVASADRIVVAQNGCYAWFSSRTPAGALRQAVGPQTIARTGPHRYHVAWSETGGDLTVTETNAYALDIDTEAGVVTGTWLQTENTLHPSSNVRYPLCGLKAE